MASCFICAVFNQYVGSVDPIGVCRLCNALACFEHGTRLKKGPEFQCALCLPKAVVDAALVVKHEAYGPPPEMGGSGGVGVPTGGPGGDDGGGGLAVAFDSHADFERVAAQIAGASSAHRTYAREVLERVLGRVIGLNEAPDRADFLRSVIVTSDVATYEAIDRLAVDVGAELSVAQSEGRLDYDLLSDAMGVAEWAIGAEVGAELSVDAIEMIPDRRLQFLLRASNVFARARA